MSVPVGSGTRFGLLDQLLPGSSGPSGNAGGLVWLTMSLSACSENASRSPSSSGKPSRSFLSVASGILMSTISPVGFILNENSAPRAAFNCRTTGSNGSGIELLGEPES